jgi:signal transduction histidine kinase
VRGKPVAVTADCRVPELTSDPMRVRQILNNLVTNAARATQTGSIEIVARRDGSSLQISVRDTGCGIAADQQERIFNAFEQVGAKAAGASGIGLGLAIVRQLVEVLGGEIAVVSALGAGATFHVRLPLEPEATPVAPEGVNDGEPPVESLAVRRVTEEASLAADHGGTV